MRVLVGCECSQVVTSAFRLAGHDAFSCDLAACYGSMPEFHIQDDLRYVYNQIKPDLFIAHPPCTFLSRAGLCRLVDSSGNIKDFLRYEKMLLARDFFLWCFSRPAAMVCIENPVPMRRCGLPKPSQYIEPYYFGDRYSKKTCLWLRGLPCLERVSLVRPVASWTDVHKSPRIRSETFSGVAVAMVSSWGGELVGLQFDLGVF